MIKSLQAALLLFSGALARDGEFGPNSPEPWLIPNRSEIGYDRSGKPIKLLVVSHMPGSTEKNILEVANAMSREKSADNSNLFDVTFMFCSDNEPAKLTESDSLHFYKSPCLKEEFDMTNLKADSGPDEILPTFKRIFRNVMRYFSDRSHVIDELKQKDFDVMTGVNMPGDIYLSHALDVPFTGFLAYLPSVPAGAFFNLPTQASYEAPLAATPGLAGKAYGFIGFRIMNLIPRNLIPVGIRYVFNDELINEHYRESGLFGDYTKSFAYGVSVEGIRDVVQWADSTANFAPLTNLNSKFSSKFTDQQLDQEYQEFLSRFDKVVLIAFGTTFMPLEADMMKIVEALKLPDAQQTGFIISLKEKETAFVKIRDMNLPNVLLSKWVPQQKLLANEKVKLFVTHCGGNSVMESLYFGTPMLGFPQNADQYGMGTRLVNLGLGLLADPAGPAEEILAKINEVSDPDSAQLHKAKQYQELLEFEEKRGGKGLVHWLTYLARFGQSHLVNPTHYNSSLIAMYDLDIKLMLLCVVIGSAHMIYLIIQWACSKKVDEEPDDD